MKLTWEEVIQRSKKIRSRYHELEDSIHGSRWSVEEDALAFLTDAGLVGRNIMSHQQRWPKDNSEQELRYKIGECMWWLLVLSERLDMNPEELITSFLSQVEKKL